MANYIFKNTYQEIDTKDIWHKLIKTIQVGSEFQSVGRNPKTYNIESMNNHSISFSGGNRKEVEDIDLISFVDVITKLKTMEVY